MDKQNTNLRQMILILMVLLANGTAAGADETTQTSRTIGTDPMTGLPSMTTTTRTFQSSPDPIASSSQVIVVKEKPVISNNSVITTTELSLPSRENFARRLEMIKEQLDNGVSKGWIASADAAFLNGEYANLLAQLDLARTQGMSRDLSNTLERQLNAFNIDLSHRMTCAPGGGTMQ